ncbi:MAG: hypothetical protein VX294_09680 [Candidatus Latescibacterota bacterium]|nr:hypothetical protein [Candidatus Latescibacterota bacterium]
MIRDITVFLVFFLSCEWCWATDLFLLRQEYNAITASLDTLVRLYDLSPIEDLTRQRPTASADLKLSLIFWADDEAEIFLNEFRVGQTRLTPTQIDIPSIYLQETNVLQAHCWDTDKVESGFMAGLYVVGTGGDLYPVLLTDEDVWSTQDGFADVRFYSNSVPDIPQAEVIWGAGMYGEVWLETQFTLTEVNRAKQGNTVEAPLSTVKPMESHAVISSIVRLNTRKRELEKIFSLHDDINAAGVESYGGYVSRRLAFSLGKAGRLASQRESKLIEKLDVWRNNMSPDHALQLTASSRRLKGVDSHVAQQRVAMVAANEKDRKSNYVPPKDYYHEQVRMSPKTVVKVIGEDFKNKGSIRLWLGFLVLSIYNCFVSRRCWRIWVEER